MFWLKYHLLRLVFKYGFFIFRIFEKPFLRKYGNIEPFNPVLFIIGAPRTGSTFVFQVITNALNVKYIDNIANLSYRNLYFGLYLSQLIYRDKSHNNFKSMHGVTNKFGFHAPNEGGEFWYRFIPKDTIYLKEELVSDSIAEKIKRYFYAILNRYKKPLVIKNLNIGLRLRLIHKILPDSKFVIIKRNYNDVANSLLKGRLDKYDNKSSWFGIKPPNYNDLLTENYKRQIIEQIFNIEKTIETDIKLFPDDNVLYLEYDKFCKDTESYLSIISRFLDVDYRENYLNTIPKHQFEKRSGKKNVEDFSKIIDQYDWINYKKKK